MALRRFSGKIAIISGGTKGIGLSTARRIGQEGCKVVISGRRKENVDQSVSILRQEGIDVSGVPCNQGIKEDRLQLIKHTVAKYGGFDCLFINAGVNAHVGNLLTATESQFDKIFDVNLKSNFMLIQESLPHFKERGGGSIVTNGTVAAFDGGLATAGKDTCLYSVSKLALSSMTNHISRDCWNQNVRVNCIAPGPIATSFLDGISLEESFGRIFACFQMEKGELASRIGKPEEVASLVAFLLSDDASYISGQTVICSGGMTFARNI